MLREKRITSLEVHPDDKNNVIIGIAANPSFETYYNRHLYLSNDAGAKFGINEIFESGLPIKNVDGIDIDNIQNRIYISTRGASTFYFKNTTSPFKNITYPAGN